MGHDPEVIRTVMRARSRGVSRAFVARRLAVPASTIANWERRGVPRPALAGACPRCGVVHDRSGLNKSYAYLLGMYLGDGHIVRLPRTWALRVGLDAAHPMIVEELALAVLRIRGRVPSVRPDSKRRMILRVSSWNAWPCLFPQHGPGRKHQRPITLEAWQEHVVAAFPGSFVRGLIHSDGWRGTNRVTSKGTTYEYGRYQFSNRSDDIRRMFCDACDLLDVAWRPWGPWNIAVSRRESVAILDRQVGRKS